MNMRTAVTELLRALLLEFNCSVKGGGGGKSSSEPAGSEMLLKFVCHTWGITFILNLVIQDCILILDDFCLLFDIF